MNIGSVDPVLSIGKTDNDFSYSQNAFKSNVLGYY